MSRVTGERHSPRRLRLVDVGAQTPAPAFVGWFRLRRPALVAGPDVVSDRFDRLCRSCCARPSVTSCSVAPRSLVLEAVVGVLGALVSGGCSS